MDNIKQLLQNIVKDPTVENYSIVCSVLDCDEAERSVDVQPLNGDAEIFDVRLQSEFNSTAGFCLIPSVGSVVIVTFLNNKTGYVSTFSEIAKVLINCDEITFNDGTNNGIVKIDPLVNKINALENKLNSLISACQSQVVTLAPAGAFPMAPFFSSVTPLLNTVVNDLENTKIKH